MTKIWNLAGRVTYYISFPLISLVMRFTIRTRLIVEFEGKILVVKGWLGDNKWFLPGGGLKRNERPELGAIRELNEETGIKVLESDLKKIGEGNYSKGITKYQYYLYHVRLKNKPTIKKQHFEIIDAKWIEIKDISKNNCSKELTVLLESWK
jgi:8-oxo-dGTP pyrophosphatase MutT (NUDIX family)